MPAEWARLESRLSRALDEGGDNADAAATVRQLMFLRRLIEQAQSALDAEELS